MSQIYNVAIAGLGKRGKVHADMFHRNPRFNVVGLTDVDNERIARRGGHLRRSARIRRCGVYACRDQAGRFLFLHADRPCACRS